MTLFFPEVFYKKLLDRGNPVELCELRQERIRTETLYTAKPLKARQGGGGPGWRGPIYYGRYLAAHHIVQTFVPLF